MTDYDPFAVAYSAHNESNVWNARYERPAVLAMAGDVGGLDVLDAGCGAGVLAAELTARGARVTGLDKSAALLDIARDRLGHSVPLHRLDLADALPFDDASFDLVVASLVMHYLPDWDGALTEFRRVLRPGGRVVISTHHPFMDHALADGASYFETCLVTDEWDLGDQKVVVEFWRRPLRAMFGAFRRAGFTVADLREPEPDPSAAAVDPDAYRTLATQPWFLFVELRAG